MDQLGRYSVYLARRLDALGLPKELCGRLLDSYASARWRGLDVIFPFSGVPPQLRVTVGQPTGWENAGDALLEQFALPLAAQPPSFSLLLGDPILARAGEELLERLGLRWQALVQPDRQGTLRVITERLSAPRLSHVFSDLGFPVPALPDGIDSARLELSVNRDGLCGLPGIRVRTETFPEECKSRCGEELLRRLENWRMARPGVRASARLNEWIFYWGTGGITGIAACPSVAARCEPDADAYDHPIVMNLELTTRCPLHCPQCYCDPAAARDMPLDTALRWLREGKQNGVEWVGLSGGETMCYPHLYEVIGEASRLGIGADVALSGYDFDQAVFNRMLAAGVGNICISINGPTEEINRLSRDGFQLAIDALELLRANRFPRTEINWVMHSTNADSFSEMLALAERYQVQALVVMAFKPDARGQLPSLPTAEQMLRVAEQIRSYKGPVEIIVEGCYAPMKAMVAQRGWKAPCTRIERGCTAGRDSFSVSVDGRLSPCRHLTDYEQADSLRDYWEHSPALTLLRQADENPRPPCSECRLLPQCRHCMDINVKLHGELFQGDAVCPLAQSEAFCRSKPAQM